MVILLLLRLDWLIVSTEHYQKRGVNIYFCSFWQIDMTSAATLTTITSVLVLTAFVPLHQTTLSNAECVAPRCFCFPEGEVECGDLYLRRIPRFKKAPNNESTPTYSYIDLSTNRIRTVRTRAFRHIQVREIRIWNNRGSLNVSHRAFRGLENVVEIISIR